jgi:antitoxin PrlF
MKESLVISDRGQITLPAAMRKSLGLGKNSVVTVEAIAGKIVLSPAIVLETEAYTDTQVMEWNRADAFGKDERTKTLAGLKKRRG